MQKKKNVQKSKGLRKKTTNYIATVATKLSIVLYSVSFSCLLDI